MRRIGWRSLFGIAAATLTFLVGSGSSRCAAEGPPFPRLANVYLHGAVNQRDIPILARWDVLVLDAVWSREQLRQLRALNPDIRLFYYTCAYCMAVDPLPSDTWRRENYLYANANDLWWRNADRSIASDWPGVQLVNVTDRAPAGPEGAWRQWFADRVEALVASRSELDGIFLDNYWKKLSWEQGNLIHVDSDCNPTHNPAGCDGVADSPAMLDTLWNRALRDFARDLHSRFDVLERRRGVQRPLAILSNGASDYFPWVNGTLYERFPSGRTPADLGSPYGYNWNYEMFQSPGGYLAAPFSTSPYRLQIVNSSWTGSGAAPERSEEFERHKRFTLGSTLLGDGYYSLDASDGHGSLWWEPEYDAGGIGPGYLGYPLGPSRRVGVPSGPETVTNGSFGTTKIPWATLATACTGDYRLDATSFHSAPTSARLDVASVDGDGSFKLHQEVSLLGGKEYTLSFWARATPPHELVVHLYSDACPGGRCLGDRRFWITSEWQEFAVSFVSTGNARAGLNFFVHTPGSVWVDDISLRLGNTAVFRRDFDRGVVLLNYTSKPQVVPLGDTYYRLRVPGSRVWDGAVLSAEIVPPSDARILLREPRPTDAPGDPPPVESPRGERLRTGPNPVAPGTSIRFTLAHDEHVRLAVYDVAGRRVRTLLDQSMPAGGELVIPWDATDDAGRRVAPGIYLCRIETPSFVGSQKLAVAM